MADNKEKVIETKAEEKEVTVDKSFSFVDPYAERRAQTVDITEEAIEEAPSSVFKTNVPIFHYVSKNPTNGRLYHNLETSWVQEVVRNGKTYKQPVEIRFTAKSRNEKGNKGLFDLITLICGNDEKVPLDIVKGEFTDDTGNKIITWTPRISCVDDNGLEIVCNLKPAGDGDKAVWNLLLTLLQRNGVLS